MKIPVIKYFCFLLISATLSAVLSCSNTGNGFYQSEIDSISSVIVPDQRIGLCNVRAVSSDNGTVIIRGETTNSIAKEAIINTLSKLNKNLIDSIIILPDTLINKKYSGLVTLSVINLRKEPDHASELVSQSIMGTPVHIIKEDDWWYLIQTPDKYIAWTEKSSVVPTTQAEMVQWRNSNRIIFTERTGWIFKGPSEDSGVVGDIVANCIAEKTGATNGYVRIKLPDGREGYVNGRDVLEFKKFRRKPIPDGEKIVSSAESLMGIPYLWGGSSAKGVDCSGFVQTVFFMNGMIMMRDASLQALHGSNIDISEGFDNLRKGDLLFFGTKQHNSPHVTHVAIYIGDNEYINSSGRVMINNLDSTKANFSRYRLNSLLMARRVLGIDDDPGIVQVRKSLWY
jgi:gamma-D-glutamyl-L-lysine dipeptidyl-peptidase